MRFIIYWQLHGEILVWNQTYGFGKSGLPALHDETTQSKSWPTFLYITFCLWSAKVCLFPLWICKHASTELFDPEPDAYFPLCFLIIQGLNFYISSAFSKHRQILAFFFSKQRYFTYVLSTLLLCENGLGFFLSTYISTC